MNSSRVLSIVLLTVVVGAGIFFGLRGCDVDYDDPRRWEIPARSANDPFGHHIFDSIMAETLPQGYRVVEEDVLTFDPKKWKGQAVMLGRMDVKCVEDLLAEGCKVMVVCYSFDPLMDVARDMEEIDFSDEDALDRAARTRAAYNRWPLVNEDYSFDFYEFKDALQIGATASLTWCPKGDTPATYQVAEQMLGSEIQPFDSNEEVIAWADDRIVAERVLRNKQGGELLLVCTPLLMTNYGILDPGASPYVVRLMSLMADRPVVRLVLEQSLLDDSLGRDGWEDEQKHTELSRSSIEYFLSQPALRAALYIIVATLLLLAFFRARRRQRPIPVYREPVNHTLEFVQIVGNIYYSRGDYKNLLYMKYVYFAEELRRRLMIDINDREADPQNMALLANKTGLDPAFVQQTVNDARSNIITESQEALDLIDKMNKILKAI